MSRVAGVPAIIEALGHALGESAHRLRLAGTSLDDAVVDWVSSDSEFGPGPTGLGGELAMVGTRAAVLGDDIDRFAGDLDAVDEAFDLSAWLGGRDRIVVTSEIALAVHRAMEGGSLERLVGELRHELALDPEGRGMEGLIAALGLPPDTDPGSVVDQLDAFSGARPEGWAGVGEESFPDLSSLVAVAGATAMAVGMVAPDPDSSDPRERLAAIGYERSHPFVSSARRNDVILTPARLRFLRDLDALMTAPIDHVLAARVAADGVARIDWTSDGCSGPVHPDAADHCIRHDMAYRNSRMIRDQWGVPQDFADDVKAFADDRLEDDVRGDTPWFDSGSWASLISPVPGIDLGISKLVWSTAVGLGVRTFGTVDTPWTPPADHRFYGSSVPEERRAAATPPRPRPGPAPDPVPGPRPGPVPTPHAGPAPDAIPGPRPGPVPTPQAGPAPDAVPGPRPGPVPTSHAGPVPTPRPGPASAPIPEPTPRPQAGPPGEGLRG